jgi:8-oxo-dGTP diphosphatase
MGSNAFESGARKAVPAVLVYARLGDGGLPVAGGRVLMIHRNSPDRPGDYHAGKWNGLGGKCEPDESPREAARREFSEEAGLDLPEERFAALGALTFPNFKAHKCEDWIVFVFTVEVTETEASHILKRSEEGELHWVPARDLLTLNLWPGDRHFIPLVAAGAPFMGTIWYDGPGVRRHWVQPLSRA